MTNLKIIRFKAYQYKELVKLFFNHYNQPSFQQTRKSLNYFFILPGVTMAGFNLLAPFSIFKGIAIYGVFFGSTVALMASFNFELDLIARKNSTALGDNVRYRF